MKSNSTLSLSLCIVGVLGVAFVSVASPSPSRVETSPPVHSGAPLARGVPVRLVIPSIKVDAPIEAVGLTKEGKLDVPKDPMHAAWFLLGPRPGNVGDAVIDGHFGWVQGHPAVFDHVSALRAGDKIYVQDDTGARSTFVVRELRTYGQSEAATEVFTSNDGKAHLNLITCAGGWDSALKIYPYRLVVYTDVMVDLPL